jgi:four helix bundle protein
LTFYFGYSIIFVTAQFISGLCRGAKEQGAEEMGDGKMKKKPITHHWELEVYQLAFDAAMRIYELSKSFPEEEKYSLTSQIRDASRSVCSNIAEAWRKRRYEAAFVSKLNDSEAEAAETQTWLAFAVKCRYISKEVGQELHKIYHRILGKLVSMITNPTPWLIPR